MEAIRPARLVLACLSFCSIALLVPATARGQVSFSTTTYSSNILWNYQFLPSGTVRADLNGDGREDFLTLGFCSGSFSVRLSTGDGAYSSPACYTIPSSPRNATNFAAGDFYGHGYFDVAVEDESGDLYIYKNATGDGTLTLASSTTLPNGPGGILAADVNHDGHIDLVYEQGNPNSGGGTIQVLFGNGDGTFTAGPITAFTMQVDASVQGIGDFDGDSNVDVLVGDSGGEEIEILYGDGAGRFTPGPSIGGSPLGVTSATLTIYQPFDIDSEGTMDMIGAPVTYTFCGTGCFPTITPNKYLDIEWGHFNRTLTSQKVPLANCAVSAAPPQAADFDGDGIADIIVVEGPCQGAGPNTLDFLKGNGNGTFQPEQVIYSTSDSIVEWHVMRASHSSKPDLAVFQFQDVNNTVTNPEDLILVNTTAGDFPSCTPLNNSATGIHVCSPAATSGTEVKFSVAGSNQTPGRDMEIWVDGKKLAESLKSTYRYYSFLDAHIHLSSGEHQVGVYSVGWDYSKLLTQFPLAVK